MKKVSLVALLALVICVACKKQTETFTSASVTDYFPLQVGKTLIYKLDSTLPVNFGAALAVKSYQAKDSIESTFIDNQGRTSYRIFRYTRDTAGKQPWAFAATYVATPTNNGLEYVDNNMRFIKLKEPIVNDYTFKAHTYIDTKSLNSTVSYLDEWEYSYQKVGEPYTVGNLTFDTTLTVHQHDETSPAGPFDPSLDAQFRSYGVEVYGKGVGLIYKEFLYWSWQKNPRPGFEDNSFGVKLTLLSR